MVDRISTRESATVPHKPNGPTQNTDGERFIKKLARLGKDYLAAIYVEDPKISVRTGVIRTSQQADKPSVVFAGYAVGVVGAGNTLNSEDSTPSSDKALRNHLLSPCDWDDKIVAGRYLLV
jgi:hypothetical protein